MFELIKDEIRNNSSLRIGESCNYIVHCSAAVLKKVQEELDVIFRDAHIIVGEKTDEIPGPQHFVNVSIPNIGTIRFEVCLDNGYKITKI